MSEEKKIIKIKISKFDGGLVLSIPELFGWEFDVENATDEVIGVDFGISGVETEKPKQSPKPSEVIWRKAQKNLKVGMHEFGPLGEGPSLLAYLDRFHELNPTLNYPSEL